MKLRVIKKKESDKIKTMGVLSENKKARLNFETIETFEGGLSLKGFEVKSIKAGRMSLKSSFIKVKDEELFLVGATVPPYQPKNTPSDYNPERERKILIKKSEIKYLIGKSKEKGLTIIPLKVYTKRGLIKIEFALAKGRKKYNKKEIIKKREIEREIKRRLKEKL